MRRRELIAFATAAWFAWPRCARAQPQAKSARLGFVSFGGDSAGLRSRVEALRAGLRELGYVEGKNLVIEFRWPRTVEQLREAAAELTRMKVDVILAPTSTEAEAARRATSTIPIVFVGHADPVGVGHVSSLARPGGNMTGLTVLLSDLTAKRLEILKETVPQVHRVGVLLDRTAHLALPFAALAVRHLAVNARMMRSSMLEVAYEDFVTVARAKGLDEKDVIARHMVPNALMPVVTIIGVDIGFLFTGSVLVETVFGWPGIGRLMFESIVKRDYPVLMGNFLITTMLVVIANLIVDLVYVWLDPRVKYQK